MSSNITINAIPSNFTDITTGGVVFNGASWGPFASLAGGCDFTKSMFVGSKNTIDLAIVRDGLAIGRYNGYDGIGTIYDGKNNEDKKNDEYGLYFPKSIDFTPFKKLVFKFSVFSSNYSSGQYGIYFQFAPIDKRDVIVNGVRPWVKGASYTRNEMWDGVPLKEQTIDISDINGHRFFGFYTITSNYMPHWFTLSYIKFLP